MHNRTTPDLLKSILTKCGELTDGTSGYHASALEYLNSVYRGVLSGGNEFGVDIADPWAWALSPKPIIVTMEPAQSVAVSLTYGSNSGAFSTAPVNSMVDWALLIDNQDDHYMIRSHASGQTDFMVDQPCALPTGVYVARAVKLDYDLVDNFIVIDDTNNKLDFNEGGAALVASLDKGVYTPIGFAAHVSTKMMTVGTRIYDHSWNSITRSFVWKGNGPFSLLLATGVNAGTSPAAVMGLDIFDYVGVSAYGSGYTLNAINRLIAPMQTFRRSGHVDSSTMNEGKIYEIDYNTFSREFPANAISHSLPDRYCVVKQQPNGIFTVRFNGYVEQPTRIEVPYIPIHQDLTDNINSIPVLPYGFREYLVYAAAYFLMLDKSDNKADSIGGLAKAKLVAMQNHNRRSLQSAGKNFGRFLPRGRY